MVDYSKWDNIEISDDSDGPSHPEADMSTLKHTRQKRAHNLRRERTHQTRAAEYERTVNNELLCRLDALVAVLKESPPNAPTTREGTLSLALSQIASVNPEQDKPPLREGSSGYAYPPTYSEMMETIAANINKTLNSTNVQQQDWPTAICKAAEGHIQSIQARQEALTKRLNDLDARKITSESWAVVTDSSHVGKPPASSSPSARGIGILDRPAGHSSRDGGESSDLLLARQFTQITPANYRDSQTFISSHRQTLEEHCIRDILGRAQSLLDDGNDALAWRHIHQALVLKWCRLLGDDGVAMFFSRIASRHEAQQSFLREVADTFQKMKAITTERHQRESASRT